MHDPLVVRAWSQVAADYDAEWGPRFAPFLADALAAFAPGPGPLLVPGCGPGEEVARLAERFEGRRILASDPAEPMLARARARLAGLERVELSLAAADEVPPLADAGGGFSSFTLQLLPERAAALRAWRAALGPAGRIAVVFWPRQREEDAWGHLGRAIEGATGKPRPDWEVPLRAQLPELGLRLAEARDLQHEVAYPSPEAAWRLLRDACSLQVLLARMGPAATRACEERWLADHGLRERAGQWVHRPCARLWLLEALGEGVA